MNLQRQHDRYAKYLAEDAAGYEADGALVERLRELLELARQYVADSLEAHEHSDGRELLEAIDMAIAADPDGGE